MGDVVSFASRIARGLSALNACLSLKIKGEEEAYNPEQGNDKEKIRMVFERMADEFWVESFCCVGC